MAGIYFFDKNVIDLSNTAISFGFTVTDGTATDTGESLSNNIRDRKNWTGWATTDSNDAANTTVEIDFDDTDIDSIFIVNHNLKAFTLKYEDGGWQDFSTPISETTNTETTNFYEFNSVNTGSLQLIITGTQVADDDKFVGQIIVTKKIGQFQNHWVISNPALDRARAVKKTLSGKTFVTRKTGGFRMGLESKNVEVDADLDIVETIFDTSEGVLVWVNANDNAQFRTDRIGYRKEDIFLMTATNDYNPEWANGFYNQGTNIKLNLAEVL